MQLKGKVISTILILVLFISCVSKTAHVEPLPIDANKVRVHYQRGDENYEPWTLWVWNDVKFDDSKGWPNGVEASGKTDYGVYFDVEVTGSTIGAKPANADGGGDGGDRVFNKLGRYREIYISDQNDDVYIGPNMELPKGLEKAEVYNSSSLMVTFSEGTEVDFNTEVTIKRNDGMEVEKVSITKEQNKYKVDVAEIDESFLPYTVTYDNFTVDALRGWVYVDAMYAYDGELGVNLKPDGTAELKMWSPMVKDVKVILYDKDNPNKVIKDGIQMEKNSKGVWSVLLNKEITGIENLTGYFYNYKVDEKGNRNSKIALDPYAPSMAPFNNKKYPTGRGAILNPRTIGPELTYAQIPGYQKREDAIIWETHVRDFTVDPSIENDLNARHGTFKAFIDKLDYISGLGVTHIQLLPIMSYMWGSDLDGVLREMEWSSQDNNYNWGYDPHSYFSVSGMYSENPSDPGLRIAELKELISEIHKRDMGVVLDVVYNHTASLHLFENLAPNYYHFMEANGTPKTSFGGGRLGTTHYMARRILVDSILYWTDVFKVDGFRFDMMGDHDAESIQLAYDKAKSLNPNILMIGEGWRTFSGDEGDPRQAADQDWMEYTSAVGSFSDEFRNELKSGFGSEGQPRFITGGKRNIGVIFDNIKGQPHNFTADEPGDVVPYIAAHDNLTLHDVIAQSIKKDPDLHQEEIHRRIRIGNAMVLTAQGTAFIHAGQEYGRTKQWRNPDTSIIPDWKITKMEDKDGNPFKFPYFIHDSYDSSDIVNMFGWEKATNSDLYPINSKTREYTSGLIKLRRSTDAFRLGTKDLVDSNVTLLYPTKKGFRPYYCL